MHLRTIVTTICTITYSIRVTGTVHLEFTSHSVLVQVRVQYILSYNSNYSTLVLYSTVYPYTLILVIRVLYIHCTAPLKTHINKKSVIIVIIDALTNNLIQKKKYLLIVIRALRSA